VTGRDAAIAQLRDEGLDVTEWRDDPGTSYEEHAHPEREVRVVLEGSITFVIAGRKRKLAAGDRIDLAPMEPHSATVGPAGAHYLAGTDRG
jgi:quercetin dioxygenase-like cupin family protein